MIRTRRQTQAVLALYQGARPAPEDNIDSLPWVCKQSRPQPAREQPSII